jgi:AraC-like DNA-binding protein
MHYLQFLAMLGAAQGALLLFMILFRFRHRGNLPLALLLLVFSLRLGTIPSWNVGVLLQHEWLWPATTPLPFLFGPFLWWYARGLGRETPGPPPLLPLHFLPYIAETVAVAVTVSTMTGEAYAQFVRNVFSGSPPLWLPVRNSLKIAVNIGYIAAAARLAFSRDTKRLSSAHRLWLRTLVIIPTGVLAAFGFVAVNPAATARLAQGTATPFIILSAAMSLLIYAFSMLVLIAPSGLEHRGIPLGNRRVPALGDDECTKLAGQVLEQLDNGCFQDSDLSLHDLAASLQVHPNRLSLAVNRACGTPFRRLLNSKRLDYFRERVRQGALEKQTILELAFEAGFPSKSTFNRVFKEETGITPSGYAENPGAGITRMTR